MTFILNYSNYQYVEPKRWSSHTGSVKETRQEILIYDSGIGLLSISICNYFIGSKLIKKKKKKKNRKHLKVANPVEENWAILSLMSRYNINRAKTHHSYGRDANFIFKKLRSIKYNKTRCIVHFEESMHRKLW